MKDQIENFLDWLYCKFCNPYKIVPGGYCPVQAEGTLPTGEYYYFRARGSQWSMEIDKSPSESWGEKHLFSKVAKGSHIWPYAGWISRREAVKLATSAIKEYYSINSK